MASRQPTRVGAQCTDGVQPHGPEPEALPDLRARPALHSATARAQRRCLSRAVLAAVRLRRPCGSTHGVRAMSAELLASSCISARRSLARRCPQCPRSSPSSSRRCPLPAVTSALLLSGFCVGSWCMLWQGMDVHAACTHAVRHDERDEVVIHGLDLRIRLMPQVMLQQVCHVLAFIMIGVTIFSSSFCLTLNSSFLVSWFPSCQSNVSCITFLIECFGLTSMVFLDTM